MKQIFKLQKEWLLVKIQGGTHDDRMLSISYSASLEQRAKGPDKTACREINGISGHIASMRELTEEKKKIGFSAQCHRAETAQCDSSSGVVDLMGVSERNFTSHWKTET